MNEVGQIRYVQAVIHLSFMRVNFTINKLNNKKQALILKHLQMFCEMWMELTGGGDSEVNTSG